VVLIEAVILSAVVPLAVICSLAKLFGGNMLG
jgi:hypothetical protein